MEITMISAVIVMAAYFLLLYGVVGFVQDKRFFGSAPKENLAAIPDKKERFPGAHTIGWAIIAVALLLFVGALTLAVWDGVKHDFGFWPFFGRFLTILYLMELYDILFFDWYLLCRSNFFPRLAMLRCSLPMNAAQPLAPARSPSLLQPFTNCNPLPWHPLSTEP